MAVIVAEFFNIIGVDVTPPETIAELIPYLLTVIVGVILVAMVFKIIYELAMGIMDWRRLR